ncbi:MAG: metabolite traffic protein EboE [Verrucomicrobiales bacterium]
MRLNRNIDFGYCTNVHRGETWEETFASLENYTLAVKERVCPQGPYGIGLRLSEVAARELSDPGRILEFQRWLDRNHCYVFTINGFPYGKFHGTRVKEQVYAPDWTSSARLDYTNLLFDILSRLLPEGRQGSVSTLPGSFKEFLGVDGSGAGEGVSFDEFIDSDDPRLEALCRCLQLCSRHIAELRESTGQDLHLGLEPEPLGLFETSSETVRFFERLRAGADDGGVLLETVGVNYDTCHLALEFEEPAEALGRLRDAGLRISKLHLSSALRLEPSPEALELLRGFEEDTYLHQVVVRDAGGAIRRWRDLTEALDAASAEPPRGGEQWRVHFHVPLHAAPQQGFGDTRDHIDGLLEELKKRPPLCTHLEMETYTWEVLPENLRSDSVVDQIVREYEWMLGKLADCGLYE